MNKYRVETRTMRTIAGKVIKYTVYIDGQGACRRVDFPPVQLGNICRALPGPVCGCKAERRI